MRIGQLNAAVKQLFIMEGAHFAGKVKESIEMLPIEMEGGLAHLQAEKPRMLEQNS